MIEKIKQRIAAVAEEACGYAPLTRVISEAEVAEILEQEEKTGGWIPVTERQEPIYNAMRLLCLQPLRK